MKYLSRQEVIASPERIGRFSLSHRRAKRKKQRLQRVHCQPWMMIPHCAEQVIMAAKIKKCFFSKNKSEIWRVNKTVKRRFKASQRTLPHFNPNGTNGKKKRKLLGRYKGMKSNFLKTEGS